MPTWGLKNFSWHMLAWEISYQVWPWANMCKQDSKIIFDFIQNESNILQADVNVFLIDPHCHYIWCGSTTKIDQIRQTSSNIFQTVLLADFSSLELRDMMSSVIIRGWWQMSSWEIQYLAQIWGQVALGNIVSCQKHYIKEYCKP